ncbi:MAG TPA: DUF190 domain-containing protein [Tepidisphaeraceae bacterium]|nr:DUF190 domain-containing protein [Tepidisphaeraceae bacterium]
MSLQGERVLFRAYLLSADRPPYTPTYELLVKSARQNALAGVTVLKGILGFGSRGLVPSSSWSISEQVPIIVEIVDAADRIASFITGPLPGHMARGMITLERAHVIMYRHRQHDQANPFDLAGALRPLSTLPHLQPRSDMIVTENAILLRIFVGESDRFEHQPLYQAIVEKARELGLAGATVLRGIEGFGANSVVHKAKLLEMSTDLPIVIEIVDIQANIQKLLPRLQAMVLEGMITMEYVMVLSCHAPGGKPVP